MNKQSLLLKIHQECALAFLLPPQQSEGAVFFAEVIRVWAEAENDSSSISTLVDEAHQNAINKGWYSEPRSFGEVIALMHSELSEALEDHRNGWGFREIYYEGDKPCGIPTELADTVIRIFDTCGHLGIDLEAAIREKMAYNATRPVRHGGKKL